MLGNSAPGLLHLAIFDVAPTQNRTTPHAEPVGMLARNTITRPTTSNPEELERPAVAGWAHCGALEPLRVCGGVRQ